MLKKILQLTLVLMLTTTVVLAQESLKNRNDIRILPQTGEYAIGFSAVPILNWVGNTFNGNQNNVFIGENKFVSNLGQNVVFGKYMLEENVAIRAHLRVGIMNDKRLNYVIDDTKNSPDSLVIDKGLFNNQIYIIGAGYEFRRGQTRLQGIYGGDIFFMLARNTASYEYGNVHGMLNQAPTTTTVFFNNGGGLSSPQGMRPVSEEDGSIYGIGLRPFAGVEYFFAPRMSIGGEFGWNISYNKRTEGLMVEEYFAPDQGENGRVIQKETPIAGSRTWFLDTDNFNGALFLMFYF